MAIRIDPHIELPDWKQCENDTPLFRINLDAFHKKMQESVEKFGTLKPTISKITQNLEELERNLEELNLQITSLQKPIFHFNAKPNELNKANSLRTRNSRQNSGNIGGVQPSSPQVPGQQLTKPVLPLKPDHFDSLKNPTNSLLPQNSKNSSPNNSPKRQTTRPVIRTRPGGTIGGMSTFLKHELIDGTTEYIKHIISPIHGLKTVFQHFSNSIEKVTTDTIKDNEHLYRTYLTTRKDYYKQVEKLVQSKPDKSHETVTKTKEKEKHFRTSRYKLLEKSITFGERFQSDVALVLFLCTQGLKTFYGLVREEIKNEGFYQRALDVQTKLDNQTKNIEKQNEENFKYVLEEVSRKGAPSMYNSHTKCNDNFISRLYLYTPKKSISSSLISGSKSKNKGLSGLIKHTNAKVLDINPMSKIQQVFVEYNSTYNSLRVHSGEDSDFTRDFPLGKKLIEMNQVNAVDDKSKEQDRCFLLALRQKNLVNKVTKTQTCDDDAYDEIFLQTKSYEELAHWRKVFSSTAGDVHLQKPLQLNRDSIRFVKLTIEHLENKKIENDRGEMVDLLTTVGIYRTSGRAFESDLLLSAIKDKASNEKLLESLAGATPTGLCSALKLFLHKITPSLFTYKLYAEFINVLQPEVLDSDSDDENFVQVPLSDEEQLSAVIGLIDRLPTINKNTLLMMINHWKRVSDYESFNKMSPINVGICLAPSVLRSIPTDAVDTCLTQIQEVRNAAELIEFLITNCAVITKTLFPETVELGLDGWRDKIVGEEYAVRNYEINSRSSKSAPLLGTSPPKKPTTLKTIRSKFTGTHSKPNSPVTHNLPMMAPISANHILSSRSNSSRTSKSVRINNSRESVGSSKEEQRRSGSEPPENFSNLLTESKINL